MACFVFLAFEQHLCSVSTEASFSYADRGSSGMQLRDSVYNVVTKAA